MPRAVPSVGVLSLATLVVIGSIVIWVDRHTRWEPEATLLLVRRELGEPLLTGAPAVLLLASRRCSHCTDAVADLAATKCTGFDRYVLVDEPLIDPPGCVPVVVDREGNIRRRLGGGVVPLTLLYDLHGRCVDARRGRQRPSVLRRWMAEVLPGEAEERS